MNTMKTEISGNFLRSKRIDSDSVDDGYVLLGTGQQALDVMAENLLHGNQRAFTWTGPYGCGKSSLALVLSSLVGNPEERARAERLVPDTGIIREAFRCDKGWSVLRIVGRQGALSEDLGVELGVIGEGRVVIDELRKLADSKTSPDGVLIIIDEAGKYLEAECASDNTYLLQELAETACRMTSKLVVVGIFHQAMDVYAARMPFALRDEWSKVQGRFIDIPLAATTDETLELLSRAIVHPADWKAPASFQKSVAYAAAAVGQGRAADEAHLTRRLTACWPLNPVTTLLLGPVSRRRFAQNERSVYSFLSAIEPEGFREFLGKATENDLYTPARYWDYLQANFETSIMATGDGHRWMTACDAIMRAENLHSAELVDLAKTVAVVDLFRAGSRLQANEGILAAAMSTDTRTVCEMLDVLVKARVLVKRSHLRAWAVYAGSDFDLEEALKKAHARQSGIDASEIAHLLNLNPIVAREYYLRTGTARWFNCRLMTSSSLGALTEEKPTDDGSVGDFVLVLPDEADNTGSSRSSETQLAEWSEEIGLSGREERLFVLGLPKNAEKIRDLALDLQAIGRVAQDPSLEGDETGRNEVQIRERYIRERLTDELGEAFSRATWFVRGNTVAVKNQCDLQHYASKLCGEIYASTPWINNELVNRDFLSTNISKARRELLYAMLQNEREENLGFSGFPPAYALYLSLLSKLHVQGENGWAFVADPEAGRYGFQPLWQATKEFLKGRSRTTLKDLYVFWRRPGFGLKYGPMPVLALAFYLGNRDSMAMYVGDAFQAEITTDTVNEWLVDPSRVAFRFIENGDRYRVMLGKLAEVLTTLNTEPVQAKALSVGRALVGLVFSAPAWSRKSTNFTPTTVKFKNVVLKASDPIQFLFEDIPNLFETEDPDVIARGVEECLNEFLGAMPKMLETVKAHLYASLQVDPDRLDDLRKRAEAIKGLSGSMVQEAFVARMCSFTGVRTNIEGLISLATNRPAQMWTDRDVQLALTKISELSFAFREQEKFSAMRGREGNRRVFGVTVASGDRDVVRTVDLTREEGAVARERARSMFESLNGLDPKIALGVLAELGILISTRSEGEQNG